MQQLSKVAGQRKIERSKKEARKKEGRSRRRRRIMRMMRGEKRGDPSYKERRAAAPLWILDGNLNSNQMALILGSWKTMDRFELCPLRTK